MRTYLILPAWSELAGQLHVVCKDAQSPLGLSDYRACPDGWWQAGLVAAAEGRLVCLDAPRAVWDELKACEPIHPPLTVHVEI